MKLESQSTQEQKAMQEAQEPDKMDMIAASWLMYARADVASRYEGLETCRMNVESLIDNCSDHNQLMLNAIQDIEPDWFDMLEDTMSRGEEEDIAGWFAVVEDLFDRARKIIAELQD
jgi:hypothetical protein